MEIWKKMQKNLLPSQRECILENRLSGLLEHLKQRGEKPGAFFKSSNQFEKY